MQKVEKLIQSGDIGPPADILSQNCQKRAIRPRNVHAHPSPDLIHLYKSTIFNRIFLSSAFTDCKTCTKHKSIFTWIMNLQREVRICVDSCLTVKVAESWFPFDIDGLTSWFSFYFEALEVEKVLAKGNITAALSEMKTAGKMIKCEFLCQI